MTNEEIDLASAYNRTVMVVASAFAGGGRPQDLPEDALREMQKHYGRFAHLDILDEPSGGDAA